MSVMKFMTTLEDRKIRCRISESDPQACEGSSKGKVHLEFIGLKHEKSAIFADFCMFSIFFAILPQKLSNGTYSLTG